MLTQLTDALWLPVRQTDPRAIALYRRHYSCRGLPAAAYRRHGIAGPGETLTLLTPLADALWLWRHYIDHSGQQGVCCAIFRTESPTVLASRLVQAACTLAWRRWPGERLYTYVDPRHLPKDSNPGYCFLAAGWRRLPTRTIGGLHILEYLPIPS